MTQLGSHAIVIGGGMGGLVAARILSDHFDGVTVLERDGAGDTSQDRPGVPQGKHVHTLLAGGQRVLEELFPGFNEELDAIGATRLRVGLDIRMDRPGFDPFPQRDLGFFSSGLTRPQLERSVRRRVKSIPNVTIEEGCRVGAIAPAADGRSVGGARCTRGGRSEERSADLVVDASGAGELTLGALSATAQAAPRETIIGVDLGYSTALFDVPEGAPSDWKGVMVMPAAPASSRGGLLVPVEGRRWMLALGGRAGEHPPGDEAGFREYAATLRTKTIGAAIANARMIGRVERFIFTESRLRHFDRLDAFPAGLLPLGDAICRFNPIFGQGMSVAAQQAVALGRLLSECAAAGGSLRDVWRPFFQSVAAIIDTPWALAAVPDFIFPETRGERPADLETSLRFGLALNKAAARHADVHKLAAEVQHLLVPRSALTQPNVIERVLAEM